MKKISFCGTIAALAILLVVAHLGQVCELVLESNPDIVRLWNYSKALCVCAFLVDFSMLTFLIWFAWYVIGSYDEE